MVTIVMERATFHPRTNRHITTVAIVIATILTQEVIPLQIVEVVVTVAVVGAAVAAPPLAQVVAEVVTKVTAEFIDCTLIH